MLLGFELYPRWVPLSKNSRRSREFLNLIHRELLLSCVNCKWKLNKKENLTCFVLFLNLLWCEVKWKLFYDAKTMFKSTLCPLLISHCFVWFGSHFTFGVTRRLLLSSRVSFLVINLLTIREKVRVKYLFPLIQTLCVDLDVVFAS